jgi:predicted flap endonuclease-1-like 5' DNA nuclease/GT2 family glycosyltransferase
MAHPVPVYDEPGVSVIIPVGPGHSPHLINALDSLEAQTFRNWEAIVVFDGEEPALPHQSGIKAFKKAYPYTKAFVTKNRGAGAARNLGMAVARAPLLYFLDADDWLDPSCLEKHIAVYMQTGEAVYSDYFGINPPDIKETEVILKQEPDRTVVHGQLPSYDCQLAQRQPDPDRPYAWCAINTLIPANLIGSVKFDESLPSLEDWEFFISLAKNGVCFHKIPEPLWVYNFHLGRRRSEGQLDRESVINMFKENNVMAKCNGCGGNKESAAPPPISMSVGEGPEGYLWASYVPQTAGKHPVWGVVKPKINYGMKQQGQKFWVHQGDAALTGKFVCGHCGRPFQVNVREQKARCPCPGASSAQPVIDTVQRATGAAPVPQAKQLQPVRVTPQSVTAPVVTVREGADKPIPVQQAEPDNFETIVGVGPATQKKLHDAGVKTFTQLGRVDRGYLGVLGIPPNAISAIMNHIEAANG